MCTFPSSPPSSCTSNQTSFINNFLSHAETASSQTSLPVSYILGQWGFETGWGTGGGLCSGCNNPGNLAGSGTCQCGGVGTYSTLADGVTAYINAMNENYGFVQYAYSNFGMKEACQAVGAGCEPESGWASDLYAGGRYNGVSCNNQAPNNNCYLTTTKSLNGPYYSTCAPTVSNDDCDGCNGCGYVGCALYETITSSCLSPYNCIPI